MSAVPPPSPESSPGPEIDPASAPDEAPASPSPEIPFPAPPAESPAMPPAEAPGQSPPEMPSSPPVQTPSLPAQTPITGRFASPGRGLAATPSHRVAGASARDGPAWAGRGRLAARARAAAAALLAVLAFAPVTHAQPASTPVSAADRRFMGDATSSGMVEIVLGRLAVEHAVGEPARHLGQQMVDDHVKANEALKALAVAKGVSLPTGLTAEEKASASRMKKLKGTAFDRTYVAKMVADHQKAVALFAQAGNSGSDSDVRAFAQSNLPTMRAHLDMAKAAAAVLVATPKRGTAARE